jgi:hypothetical protein
MTVIRYLAVVCAVIAAVFAGPLPGVAAPSVGQMIDDTAITAEIKTKLAADRLSNLTRIQVSTDDGIVTLAGVVDEPERVARAAQIASGVNGVRGIVNNVHVAGTTIPPAPPVVSAPSSTTPPVATPAPVVITPPVAAPPVVTSPVVTPPVATTPPAVSTPSSGAVVSGTTAPGMRVDATGVIASVDRNSGTITLQDGRVVRVTDRTMVWQPIGIDALRPGAQVYVREAAPIAQQQTPGAAADWRMGTVRTVDRTTNQLVLTDGTIVRVTPSAVVRRGSERLAIDQILPGSEVVVRAAPRTGAAEGSALPGPTVSTSTVSTSIDASEVTVVWTPVNGAR